MTTDRDLHGPSIDKILYAYLTYFYIIGRYKRYEKRNCTLRHVRKTAIYYYDDDIIVMYDVGTYTIGRRWTATGKEVRPFPEFPNSFAV